MLLACPPALFEKSHKAGQCRPIWLSGVSPDGQFSMRRCSALIPLCEQRCQRMALPWCTPTRMRPDVLLRMAVMVLAPTPTNALVFPACGTCHEHHDDRQETYRRLCRPGLMMAFIGGPSLFEFQQDEPGRHRFHRTASCPRSCAPAPWARPSMPCAATSWMSSWWRTIPSRRPAIATRKREEPAGRRADIAAHDATIWAEDLEERRNLPTSSRRTGRSTSPCTSASVRCRTQARWPRPSTSSWPRVTLYTNLSKSVGISSASITATRQLPCRGGRRLRQRQN